MKANELRIGNLVKSGTGIYKIFAMSIPQIFAIQKYDEPSDSQSNIYESNNTIIEPIPLTAEWLEKFGFVRHSTNEFWFRKKNLCISCVGAVELISWDMQIFRVDLKIEHIHQLQNLYFALTGEELTIGGGAK